MRHSIAVALWMSLAAMAGSVVAAESVVPPFVQERQLEPFDYRGVVLDDGPLRRQVDEVKRAYLAFDNNDFLRGYRLRAGLPAPGKELGGWYSADHFMPFGQVLSGLARLYAATEDAACKEKLDALIAGWAETIEPDGYFFYSRQPNATHYGYEKMVCGLVDSYLYAGHRDALAHLARITAWAEKHLDRSNPYAFSGPGDPGEWYTLSENLYRAYLASGESRYRDFARVWEYEQFWRSIRTGADFYGDARGHHAYSHINSLSGAAMAYRLTGRGDYLTTLVRGFDYLQDHQVFATGGYGPGERLLPSAALQKALDDHPKHDHFETQCASWAAFKLAKYLMTFTGEARYGDWIERLAINATGASLPVSPAGEAMYYSHYGLSGGAKDYSTGPWTCCSGTRIQAVADYHDLVYFRGGRGADQNALYVNLYTPSTCHWKLDNVDVTVRQQTRFPEDSRVELAVAVKEPVAFAIKLRSPGWLAAPMKVFVNGGGQPATVDGAGWVVLAREWHDGDRVVVDLPMSLGFEPFPPDSSQPFPAAIVYGPTVLAFEGGNANPARRIDWTDLSGCLRAVAGEPLNYHLAGSPAVRLRPFYSFGGGELYYIYLDPQRAWTRVPRAQVRFSQGWKENAGGLTVTKTPGESIEYTFEGSAIRWVGRKFDDGGIAQVFLDGKLSGTVDLYVPDRKTFFQHDIAQLPTGRHTVRIVTTAERNSKSRGQFINFLRFEVVYSESKH